MQLYFFMKYFINYFSEIVYLSLVYYTTINLPTVMFSVHKHIESKIQPKMLNNWDDNICISIPGWDHDI